MQLCYSWSTKKREREHSKREAELWVMVQGFAAGLTTKEFMTLVGQYKNKGAWASDEVDDPSSAFGIIQLARQDDMFDLMRSIDGREYRGRTLHCQRVH
ncbi:MAG: hypothetical protein EZS28_021946 [Streblomastix strix]|uniref:RRM domain-containing protein n=1 Tax=Streblomastix strix TaxID=222440 RepID=A0A5J4VJG8_9EUKA|nr:MAG: hypothetical protein EZS28_021946 [Streblomastix strix]